MAGSALKKTKIQERLLAHILVTMNYDQKVTKLSREATKSLYALLVVLDGIDEDDPNNADNEWSITDEDGGVVLLGYAPKTKELTITRNGLKLTLNAVQQPIKTKRKVRYVLKKN